MESVTPAFFGGKLELTGRDHSGIMSNWLITYLTLIEGP